MVCHQPTALAIPMETTLRQLCVAKSLLLVAFTNLDLIVGCSDGVLLIRATALSQRVELSVAPSRCACTHCSFWQRTHHRLHAGVHRVPRYCATSAQVLDTAGRRHASVFIFRSRSASMAGRLISAPWVLGTAGRVLAPESLIYLFSSMANRRWTKIFCQVS